MNVKTNRSHLVRASALLLTLTSGRQQRPGFHLKVFGCKVIQST
jgi:hypothetical protein